MPDAADARARLRADCSRCAGLCCVAPAFAASADFAIDEAAGHACSGALFLTRRQVAGARGDATTVLPAGLEHPPHRGAR